MLQFDQFVPNGFVTIKASECRDNRPPRFHRVKAPDKGELEELITDQPTRRPLLQGILLANAMSTELVTAGQILLLTSSLEATVSTTARLRVH